MISISSDFLTQFGVIMSLVKMYPALLAFLVAFMFHGYAAEQYCPDPQEIAPCTCFKDLKSGNVTALCQNFTRPNDIGEIFKKNPNWTIQTLHIDNCTMSFIPKIVLEQVHFQKMNVSNSVLDTLFEAAPKKTSTINLYMRKVKMMRGFEWQLFSKLNLKDLVVTETQINQFGGSFKDSMPHAAERIMFEGTSTLRINEHAFDNLKILRTLSIRKAMLKTLSRNMFPQPWTNMSYLDFSYNKIMTLPEDILDGMPKLEIFLFERNLLTTLSERIFSRKVHSFLINNPLNCNCNMKWITSDKVARVFHNGKCETPANVKGKELQELTKADFAYCK